MLSQKPSRGVRKRAAELHAEVRPGRDPGQERDDARQKAVEQAAENFKIIADRFLADHGKTLRPRYSGETRRYLQVAAKPLHHRPISGIERRDVAALLSTASSARGHVTAKLIGCSPHCRKCSHGASVKGCWRTTPSSARTGERRRHVPASWSTVTPATSRAAMAYATLTDQECISWLSADSKRGRKTRSNGKPISTRFRHLRPKSRREWSSANQPGQPDAPAPAVG